jgi:hypothetical protein
MNGGPTIANDDLEKLMALLMANNDHLQIHWLASMQCWCIRLGFFITPYALTTG